MRKDVKRKKEKKRKNEKRTRIKEERKRGGTWKEGILKKMNPSM